MKFVLGVFSLVSRVQAYVGELVVRADRERQGVARQLMSAGEDWAAGGGT
jgi:GNAT superfamily N-acetyltransferase